MQTVHVMLLESPCCKTPGDRGLALGVTGKDELPR